MPNVHPDMQALADRIADIERRVDRAQLTGSLPAPAAGGPSAEQIASAFLALIDTRFGELSAQMERRFAELEIRIQTQYRQPAIESQFQTLRGELTGELDAMRGQMVESQKAFGATLSAVVEEQIEHSVAQRVHGVHEQIRDTVRNQLSDTTRRLEAIDARASGLRADLTAAIETSREVAGDQIAHLTATLEAINARIDAVRTDLAAALEANTTRAETRRAEFAATVEAGQSAARDQVSALAARLEAIDARDFAQAEQHQSALQSRTDALRTDLTSALNDNIAALRNQMVESQREFSETLARVVEEQIEHSIGLRLQAIQEQMRETVRDESLSAYTSFGNAVETTLEKRLETFRDEIGGNQREISELCSRLQGHEHNLLELVLALGQRCMQAADWMLPGVASQRSISKGGAGGGFPSEPHIAPAGDPAQPPSDMGAPRSTRMAGSG